MTKYFLIKKKEREKNVCILLKLREFSKWEYNRLVVNESVMESVKSHTAPSTSAQLLKLYSSLKCLNLIVLNDKSIKQHLTLDFV